MLSNKKEVPIVDLEIPAKELYSSARKSGGIQNELRKRIKDVSGIDIDSFTGLMTRCIVRPLNGSSFSPDNPNQTYVLFWSSLIDNGVDRPFTEIGDFFNSDSLVPEYLVFNHDRSGFIKETELNNYSSFILTYDLFDEPNQQQIERGSFDIRPFYTSLREAIRNNNQSEFFQSKLRTIYRIRWTL